MDHAIDARLMRRALRLAQRGKGRTAPNPMVGAVVIKNGRVIGEGYHKRLGGPHAEVEALRAAGARARGGTLVVTLEPCNHVGRTGPCCDALIRAEIKRVVIGTRDPNPITNGRGLTRLRRAGIHVTTGVLEREARLLNAPFEKAMTRRLPLVTAKIAQSLDGKIATTTGASRWITSPQARRLGHRLRRDADAVLVGVHTVLRDDPRLTVRAVRGRRERPITIIVDSTLRTPLTARCVTASPTPTIIATTRRSPAAKRRALVAKGAEVIVLPARHGRVSLRPLFCRLALRGVQSLLIEGGGEILAGALAERLIDRVVWCIAPILIGGRDAPPALGGRGIRRLRDASRLTDVRIRRVGPDICLQGSIVYPGIGRRTTDDGRRTTNH